MPLSLGTWNILSANPSQYQTLRELLKMNLDIVCLQELNQQSVRYLQTLKDYHFSFGVDFYEKKQPFFNGILSRIKPVASEKVTMPAAPSPSSVARFFHWDEGKFFLYNDYQINGKDLRVFSTHLTFSSGPTHRFQQMK